MIGGSNKMLTREEAAGVLGVSVKTVDRLRETGDLKSHRVGAQIRIRERDIEAYLQEHEA